MSCYMRLMRKEDIAQVTEIDREAFPSIWPPVNYHHEFHNRLARHIVVCSEEKVVEEVEVAAIPQKGFPHLVARIRQLFNNNRSFSNSGALSRNQYILGFAGFWMMADEAHIINIAVREIYRNQGIGELLLISIIDLAIEIKVQFITLEVRASNLAAQGLYAKYGFTKVGVRQGYYTDNREDGILLSTENVSSASFQARLQQLKQAHSKKYGAAFYQFA